MSNIYLFNSGHEQEILFDSPSYTLPERSTKITQDFQVLPMWYVKPGDFVLVYDSVSDDFRKSLEMLGFKLPKQIAYSDLYILRLSDQIFSFIPWGLSPAIVSRIQKAITFENNNLQLPTYNGALFKINSRWFVIDILQKIRDKKILAKEIEIPQIFDDFKQLADYITTHKDKILIKSPYSSSGIGLLWIKNGLQQSETQILKGFLRRQGSVVIEKVYTKVLDFALEYTFSEDSFVFRGISLFSTNNKGAYQGNILCSQENIAKKINKYIPQTALEEIKILYVDLLNTNCSNLGLSCIGIDMMVIETNEGYVIHPCVEINPRYNMGYLAIEFFDRHVLQSSSGSFQILFDDSDRLEAFVIKQQIENPIVMQGNKIKKGFLAMTPVVSDTKYLLYALLED